MMPRRKYIPRKKQRDRLELRGVVLRVLPLGLIFFSLMMFRLMGGFWADVASISVLILFVVVLAWFLGTLTRR